MRTLSSFSSIRFKNAGDAIFMDKFKGDMKESEPRCIINSIYHDFLLKKSAISHQNFRHNPFRL